MMLKFFAAVFLCGTLYISAQTQQQAPLPADPNAKVIFSRSDDQTAVQPPAQTAASSKNAPDRVTDAQRAAVTFTAYDLDLHLAPRDHALSARALLQIRNDGVQPLTTVPLQLSSSLNFEGVSLNGQRLPFTQFTLNSDTDHTGLLHEAAIQLPAPLAPKASVSLAVVYSGTVETDARRLVQLGTPDDAAAQSDWDRISEDFTGLRGFGNVVWYPVASVPALFGDGDKVFHEIGRQKLRGEDATISIHLTIEYYLAPPAAIMLDGQSIAVPKPSVTPTQQYPGIITTALAPTKLGFAAPSLFLASAAPIESNGVRIYARSEDAASAQGLITAASMVQPLLTQWLGEKPKSQLTVIDLPEPQDLPWQQGALLVTEISNQAADAEANMMADALAHAYFQSPREWLSEGVPNFLETLWIEHTADRTRALEQLESQRSALALAEPATPGDAPGEDLPHASDPVYYRTKATYVLWMLRDIAGEKALAAALQAYDPAKDTAPEYFQKLLERASGKDLGWFFNNWVYSDRGLPDISIAAFHSSSTSHQGLYLAAIDIMNDGFAEAEVPVTVRSGNNTLTERVLLPGKTRTVHRMLIQGEPDQVIVNDGTVPEVQADIHQRNISEP
jgi:hypothetical protein